MTKFSLQLLDEYAKSLTFNLAKMLYEKKLHKKFDKPLYENMCYQNDKNFSLHLSKEVLNESNLKIKNILLSYVNKFNLLFNKCNEGITLYTDNIENYIKVHQKLLKDGMSKNTLRDISSNDMIEIIENL